jgi:hypothetical protein
MGIEYSVTVADEGVEAPWTPKNRRREPLEHGRTAENGQASSRST